MLVRYKKEDGTSAEVILADKPLTIGRSPDADIVVLDERASRMHCGLRLWDNEYYIKDLKSKNGTFLNNERVEMAKIKPGDKIRIGTFIMTVADENAPAQVPGTNTALNQIEAAMGEGKGYNTILREIVDDSGPKPKGKVSFDSASGPETSTDPAAISADEGDTKETKVKPPVKIKKIARNTITIKRAPK